MPENDIREPAALSDDELHRIATGPYTAFDARHQGLATGLLAARARITELTAGRDIEQTMLRNAAARITELEAAQGKPDATLVRLLREFVDPDPCWFDHHGGCQAHGALSLEPGEICPHEEAKRWLADHAPSEEATDA